jgi:hypothetical protein
MAQSGFLADLPGDRIPVLPRHADIEQEHIGLKPLCLWQGGIGVGDRLHEEIARFLKEEADHFADGRFIVDTEDSRFEQTEGHAFLQADDAPSDKPVISVRETPDMCPTAQATVM